MNPLDFPEVPASAIAQAPNPLRDESRLLILERATGKIQHRRFRGIGEFMAEGDVLVLNDTRVIPARLEARKSTGGKLSVLLLKHSPPGRWAALISPRPKMGLAFQLAGGIKGEVVGQRESGEYEVAFSEPIEDALARLGRMPLPPYIRRAVGSPTEDDQAAYQTVYAKNEGAVAAPTAGLHFTPPLLASIRQQGVQIVFVTLHVGWGTFRPLAADYKAHRMLPEAFQIPEATAEAINAARERGHAVWACGTTTVRTLESQADAQGRLKAAAGETGLYITPGHTFRAVDKLITNFHMPDHTPLLLAAAFAGVDTLRRAYAEAIWENYRFYSYGDAMAIL